MLNELDTTYETAIEVAHLNKDGVLKPHAYQILFSQIAERHLNRFHLNADDTMEFGIAWALISLQVEIRKQVKGCEPLFAQTWHAQQKGPFFRRELVFRDKTGEVVFEGSTFSILLDMEKRSIYRKKELPFQLPTPTEIFRIEAKPTKKIHMDFSPYEERKVYPSYIDILGHVNNCRYAEFAYDAFNEEELQNLNQLKRLEVYFESELRQSDAFTIGKAYEGSSLFVRGHNNAKKNTAFDVILKF